jgi:effector-binding domain-containing protein
VETVVSQSVLEARPAKAVGKRAGRDVASNALDVTEPCDLITLAPRSVLVMRFRSPAADLPRGFFHRYALLTGHLAGHAQTPASPPFAIYDNIDDNAADVEAGFVVGGDVDGAGDMIAKSLPGATMATLVHVGAYSNIEPTYFRLLEWMHERGLTRSGRFMETYLNSPVDTPERELLTQIMVPVGPVSANDL